MRSEWRYALGWPLALMAGMVLLTPWFGAETVSPASLANSAEWDIFARFRLLRLALGLLAGASLAVAGCLFQAILRNPLASPFTLGVSSGSALGAVIMIVLDWAWVWTGSIAGALVALGAILGIGKRDRGLTASSLILAGVSVSSLCSALIILLQSSAGLSKSFSVTTWLIGSLDALSPQSLLVYAMVVLPLAAWVIGKAPDWDLLSMGEAWAAGRGVRVHTSMWQACLAGSMLTAATVTLTGPIGFVGLMVPHIVRQFTGGSHRRLLPATFVCGAAFLALCDTAARTLVRPAEIPVGVITAILGGPGLIWILRSTRKLQ